MKELTGIGSVRFRRDDAPPWGHSGAGWPLAHREWFDEPGPQLRMAGFAMAIAGGVLSIVALLVHYL